ncbi:MAG: TRAP transporter large permease subunit, partial [Pseudomonadota bacterium]
MTMQTLEPTADEMLHRDIAVAKDGFGWVDHISRFSGLAVAQLYLVCAAVTVYEVISRYVFNAPTDWAFEVAMVVCAVAWMVSAGYVTLKKRHIGITVFYIMAGEGTRWWLDLLAYGVGVLALFLLADDTMIRALESIDLVEKTGSAFNSPQPMLLKTVLLVGALVYLLQLTVQLWRHFESPFARNIVLAIGALIFLRLGLTGVTHYTGAEGVLGQVHGAFSAFGEIFNPKDYVDARAYDLGTVSLCIVALLLLLMTTGMPLGIVTLFVSVLTALAFFGPNGLYLVSSNAFGLLEKYPLVAVPLFVLMASILEKAGVARDLFDAMNIFAGNFRGGVAVQTVAVAVVLAAMSGVMGGEIVMLGLVALPQMLRLGYNKYIAIGVICAAGSLATLIPPSIIMIVYGLSADVAIGDLFLAG